MAHPPVSEQIFERLETALAPEHVAVRDESRRHAHHAAMRAGHGGHGETHLHVEIVAARFEGLTRLERHQAVMAVLDGVFADGVHALSLRLRTPAEAAAQGAHG
ncbi:BolA family protein [Pararhodospirillum oryzae]|uniref:Transcriptional regulator n=1 Tax=Pararhodospirillum oryzae TaxID=478448 RepID=A0A512H4F9_9PROT|nr:BolA family protein [Pararhodospirillum oryzae]GEO80321.1 transcriptional regulator [Pararhodospirillum oryzae]